MPKPGISIPARVGKPYTSSTRKGTLTELHISFEDWGKLQGLVVREAARGLGFSNGNVVLSIFRPEGDAPSMAAGQVAIVRRGAKAGKNR